ncbi:rhodanese-like domain-containing protein [Crocosphaera chwakensis]|uniref:Rhodanese-related sulfurtransferase n=1 Tax=Crocosphaera chwakensis CCY0110 TaxID=391612 RepID=A3IWM8_9CHRO|nr:rhodanese-like domain-containing protein [Crocosphaera chwakensis]EAZ89139.1 Rhodanese-related sulfurtransferase [Crocosphaera chwakensis CCY0110]
MTATTSLKPSVTNISPQEFHQLSNRPLLIDVRSNFEYVRGHAQGAVNISLPRILMAKNAYLRQFIFPKWFRDLPKDKPIAVICLTAHRSPIAANFLLKMGFTKVLNVTGGMRQWWQLDYLNVTSNQPEESRRK